MADDKKEKKDQDGSLDFFLNFMKKRTNENTSKQNKNENVEIYLHELDKFEYVCEDIKKFFDVLYNED